MIKYIFIVLLLTSCSEWNTVVEEYENQLNCEPAESDGCAGWLPKE